MTYTDISICSKALLKLGADSISSFEEGTVESSVAGNLYQLVRDSLLSSYPWSFAVAQKKLPLLNKTPEADYQYAHLLPNDFLRVISIGSGGRGRGGEYRVFEDEIHNNLSDITLTYIARRSENLFPAFFIECLVAKLASEMCLPLTESTSRAEYLRKLSEEEITKARLIDSQQATPKRFEDFSLINARR